jgi:hypothetical protein|tara:strand:+ start:10799 stop:11341 length:543 start_codon:yes stop_codon:yes gene_type:complete
MNTLISFSNYYRFKAKLYAIPTSQNRLGIDPYPRYFIRAKELIEVMEYSESPASIDDGYTRDETSGLFLRNHSKLNDGTVTEDDVQAQFTQIAMNTPYWYSNEASYIQWVQANMAERRSSKLEAMFTLFPTPTLVQADVDPDIPVQHLYIDIEEWTTKNFSRSESKPWPKQTKTTIYKIR